MDGRSSLQDITNTSYSYHFEDSEGNIIPIECLETRLNAEQPHEENLEDDVEYGNEGLVLWSRCQTLRLIETYKKFRNKVGTLNVKTKKKMWELIAAELGEGLTASQCDNKWKVLDRNYKNFIDNRKKTGRGRRKPFEFFKEMDEVFVGKKNVNPAVLLDSQTVSSVLNSTPQAAANPNEKNCSPCLDSIGNTPPTTTPKRKNTRARYNVFDEYRKDKKKYQDKVLLIHEERLSIDKERLLELKEKNRLRAERNKILFEERCKCFKDESSEVLS